MTTISIQVSSGTKGTATKVYPVSDADIDRLIAWATKIFATPPTAQVPNPPALTATQALTAWADSLMQGTVGNVTSAESVTAVAALPPVTPIKTT